MRPPRDARTGSSARSPARRGCRPPPPRGSPRGSRREDVLPSPAACRPRRCRSVAPSRINRIVSCSLRDSRPPAKKPVEYYRKVMNLDQFAGINAAYVLELYERYRQDPESVDSETRKAFESWTPTEPAPADTPPVAGAKLHVIVGAANLAESIRRYGHLAARVDPLGSAPIGDPSLSPRAHGLTDDDLKQLPAAVVGGLVAEASSSAYEAIEKLRRVYCSTTGFDYAHVFVPEEREWLRSAAESGRFLPPMDENHSTALLDRITQVEVFERFLHRTFPGKTRFSIEGLDMMVPVLTRSSAGPPTAAPGTR